MHIPLISSQMKLHKLLLIENLLLKHTFSLKCLMCKEQKSEGREEQRRRVRETGRQTGEGREWGRVRALVCPSLGTRLPLLLAH